MYETNLTLFIIYVKRHNKAIKIAHYYDTTPLFTMICTGVLNV